MLSLFVVNRESHSLCEFKKSVQRYEIKLEYTNLIVILQKNCSFLYILVKFQVSNLLQKYKKIMTYTNFQFIFSKNDTQKKLKMQGSRKIYFCHIQIGEPKRSKTKGHRPENIKRIMIFSLLFCQGISTSAQFLIVILLY